MVNKLSFEILTDAPYTDEEMESLKESFVDFILNIVEDQDADGDSAKVSISNADDMDDEISDEMKAKVIADFVANSTLEYNVQARFRDEDDKVVGKPFVISGTLDNGVYEQGE